jgi:transposase-like protein
MKRQRKRYSPEEKVAILRQHLVEKVPVSDVCEEHGLNPTVFYRWQKEFFEKGGAAFQRSGDQEAVRLKRRVAELEEKLARKNEVVSELMEEYIAAKKDLGAL